MSPNIKQEFKMKIKMFTDNKFNKAEDQANYFLNDFEDDEIIDIQYNIEYLNDNSYFNVMVVYKDS